MRVGMYRHYKGTECEVIGLAKHSETLEELVVYWHPGKESGEMELWVRPREMFEEEVEVGGQRVKRFEWVGEA